MKQFDFNNEKYQLGHLFLDSMKNRPDAIHQIDAATGESESNASVLRRSIQFARCLRRFGTQPGDVLALGGRNHLDQCIPFYAALLNGMPIAAVDPLFEYSEIKWHFKVTSPRIAFCQTKDLDTHLRVIKELELNTKLICFDNEEYSMRSFIEQYDDAEGDEVIAPLEFDTGKIYAWLMSTGGTTGVNKIAAFKHKTCIAKITGLQIMATNKKKKNEENNNGLQLSPIHWLSAHNNLLRYPMMGIIKITTSAEATTEHIIDIINKYKPVYGTIAPSILKAIIKREKKCDLTCFDNILVSGSKFEKELNLALRKRMRSDAFVTEVYGQTENLGIVLKPNPTGPIGNCGKADNEWHYIKLVDAETGIEITQPYVSGEVWSKGLCFAEYYNNPEETASAFTEDGWYKTGDILYKDEDGNYYFVERINLVIVYRNYYLAPAEIEAVIREHPGVYDVVVTSVPHEVDGQHPVACVVRKQESTVTAQEIKNVVASQLPDSRQLRGGVVFMDTLPMTSSGKVAQGKLRQMVLTAYKE